MGTKKKTADADEKALAMLEAVSHTREFTQERNDLVERLTNLAPNCKKVLIDNLKSPHRQVREVCVIALGEVLKESAPESWEAAQRTFYAEFAAMMPDEPGIGGVPGNRYPTIRLGGVHRIKDKELGSVEHRADMEIARALAPLIKDPDERVQEFAIGAFMHIVATGELVKPMLYSFFKEPLIQNTISNASLLYDLTNTIDTLRFPDKELLAIYDRLVDLNFYHVAIDDHLSMHLWPLGPMSIPTLLKLIRSRPGGMDARIGSEILIDFGHEGYSALKSLLKDENPDVQLLAALQQVKCGLSDPETLRVVALSCHAGNARQRSRAVQILRKWQKRDPSVVGDLKKMAESGRSDLRMNAITALTRLSTDRSLVLPALTSALKSRDVRLRLFALRSVRKAKVFSALFVRLVSRAFEVEELRPEAAKTLGAFGAKGKDAVPTLTKFLKTANEDLLKTVVTALGKIGPPAARTVAQLSKLEKNGKGPMKSRIRNAIRKIETIRQA